jgi:Family of unknown function (DUF5670)
MLMVAAVVLFLIWALAVISATTMGGLVHLLLVGAIALVLARIIQIRRTHRMATRS